MVSFLNFPYEDIMQGKYDVRPSKQTPKDFIPLIVDLLENHPETRSVAQMTLYLMQNNQIDCAVWLSGKTQWFNSMLLAYTDDNPLLNIVI